jgi:copper chaperone NosL
VASGLSSVVRGRATGVASAVALIALAVLLAACGGGTDTTQPPEILYGQDVCDECDMIISEEKYASAYWTAEGEARRFDDVGEMLVYMAENPEPTASVWVHDVNSAAWLPAAEAWFVMNSGLRTPMGTGIAVLGDEQAARALAYDQPEAVVMTFDEIVAAALAGELMNVHGMMP